MQDLPETQVPQFDDDELERMLASAKQRSARLRRHRLRSHLVATVTSLALIVALAMTSVVFGFNGGTTSHRATRTGLGSPAALRWTLVGEITASWHKVGKLSGIPGLSLACPSSETCYAADLHGLGPDGLSSVEITTDGGRTWTSSELPVHLLGPTKIACASATACALLGFSGSSTCSAARLCTIIGNPSATFEETTDSGRSWTVHSGPGHLESLIGVVSLSCSSGSSCLVAASDAYSATGAAETFLTVDGGRAWSASRLPEDFMPYELRCPSSLDCILSGYYETPVPGGTSSDGSAPAGTLLYTTEAGATWKTASVPGALGSLGAVSCGTAVDCLAVFSGDHGGAGTVLSSTDGGARWSSLAASGLPDGLVLSASCPTADRCWAAGMTDAETSGSSISIGATGAALIASTSDGGQTWRAADVPAGVTQVASIACPSATQCYALGFVKSPASGMSFFSVVLLSFGR